MPAIPERKQQSARVDRDRQGVLLHRSRDRKDKKDRKEKKRDKRTNEEMRGNRPEV